MARSLQQIMNELDPYYSSSKKVVQSQLDAAPEQQAAELSGLDAKLAEANDNILSSARQRGLGFSGIPVGEQAKYAATDYAPAVAGLKAKFVGQGNTLLETLNQLGRDQLSQAQGVRQGELSYDLSKAQLAEQKRQFDAQQKAAAATAARAVSFGGGSLPQQQAPVKTPEVTAKSLSGNRSQQDAYNAVKSLLLTNDKNIINRTISAISQSARNGNTYDQYKLELLQTPQFTKLYKGQIAIPYYGASF